MINAELFWFILSCKLSKSVLSSESELNRNFQHSNLRI